MCFYERITACILRAPHGTIRGSRDGFSHVRLVSCRQIAATIRQHALRGRPDMRRFRLLSLNSETTATLRGNRSLEGVLKWIAE